MSGTAFSAPGEGAVEDEVRDLIAELMKTTPERVEQAQSFTDEFGVDSLALIEMLVRLEKRFGVQISEDNIPRLNTLRSACTVVAERIDAAGDTPVVAE